MVLATIEHELAETGIDPSCLTFEITETAAIVNIQKARAFAERIAELGCSFALDDFGAGFGSFYYLKHLPFDVLKIDGEFVRNLTDSVKDQAVVKSLARIATELGKQTVAEFVEDAETLELVRRYGVDFAQGFHIGVPEPVVRLARAHGARRMTALAPSRAVPAARERPAPPSCSSTTTRASAWRSRRCSRRWAMTSSRPTRGAPRCAPSWAGTSR